MTIEPIHCLAGDIRPGVKCDISCWQNYVFEKGSDKATSIICKRGGGWVSSFSCLKWTVWGKSGRSGVKVNSQSGFNRAILVTESGWPSMDGLKDFKLTVCESGRPWNQKEDGPNGSKRTVFDTFNPSFLHFDSYGLFILVE